MKLLPYIIVIISGLLVIAGFILCGQKSYKLNRLGTVFGSIGITLFIVIIFIGVIIFYQKF